VQRPGEAVQLGGELGQLPDVLDRSRVRDESGARRGDDRLRLRRAGRATAQVQLVEVALEEDEDVAVWRAP